MRLPHLLIIFGGGVATVLAEKIAPDPAIARENAPQIFNAVHSAMRQWGSSGMTLKAFPLPAART